MKPVSLPVDHEALLDILESFGADDSDLDRLIEQVAEGALCESSLPPSRQLGILQQLIDDLPRAEDYARRVQARGATGGEPSARDKERAQWVSLATTTPVEFFEASEEDARRRSAALVAEGGDVGPVRRESGRWVVPLKGHRVSFAFYKTMCVYKARTAGCRYCNLSARNRRVQSITSAQQLLALEDGLARTRVDARDGGGASGRTVFEILLDGSFLNDFEVPRETQVATMRRLAKEPAVRRVAIEPRPEYCEPRGVARLLGALRSDQRLEIYFGLEAFDEFISTVIHKKGYGPRELKRALTRLVDGLEPEHARRLRVAIYALVKPPYLTEPEAIEAAVETVERSHALSREVGLFAPMKVKLEPAVMTHGTLLDWLHRQRDEQGRRRYRPLSYFSVAEIIARLADRGLHRAAKFGQRDDIGEFGAISMVASPRAQYLVSPFDLTVYNAVQRFNTCHDLRGFAVDIGTSVLHSEEFSCWEELACGSSGRSTLRRVVTDLLAKGPLTSMERARIAYQDRVREARDAVESSAALAHRLRVGGAPRSPDTLPELTEPFESRGLTIFEVRPLRFVDSGTAQDPRLPPEDTAPELDGASTRAAFWAEVIIFNESGEPQSVWGMIPLAPGAAEARGAPPAKVPSTQTER